MLRPSRPTRQISDSYLWADDDPDLGDTVSWRKDIGRDERTGKGHHPHFWAVKQKHAPWRHCPKHSGPHCDPALPWSSWHVSYEALNFIFSGNSWWSIAFPLSCSILVPTHPWHICSVCLCVLRQTAKMSLRKKTNGNNSLGVATSSLVTEAASRKTLRLLIE